jgi:hypothetical protein
MNKNEMRNPKAIFLDAGVWESMEKKEPVMTFGLLEHNAIALCSYYYKKGRTCYQIPEKSGNVEYDFAHSLMNKFLGIMMRNKYYKEGMSSSERIDISARGYHILKLIPFPPRALLDDDKILYIFIPDLHLHYFKGTYLDNFVTYFGNKWDGRPKSVPLGSRRSMEIDFGNFLHSIIEFQGAKDEPYRARVVFLGDMFDLWETNGIFQMIDLNDRQEMFDDMQHLIGSLLDEEKLAPEIHEFIKQLHALRIAESPSDPEFVKQEWPLVQARLSKENSQDRQHFEKLCIRFNKDSLDEVRDKAKNIEREILEKYCDREGNSFQKLIDQIGNYHRVGGNHDNFFYLQDPKAVQTYFLWGNYAIKPEDHVPYWEHSKRAAIFFEHGNNFESVNCDRMCGWGYLITSLVALVEEKQHGDILKNNLETFMPFEKTRQQFTDATCQIFYYWDQKDLYWDPKDLEERSFEKEKRWVPGLRNNVMIYAHTHVPALEDITIKYSQYRNEEYAKLLSTVREVMLAVFWPWIKKVGKPTFLEEL